MSQTVESLEALVADCQFKDWNITLNWDGDKPYVQVKFLEKDEFTGKTEMQHCRKHYISMHSCDTEVIDTVFLAVDRAMDHEVKESFKFRGRRIYNPHISVHKLWELAGQKGIIDLRKPPLSLVSTATSSEAGTSDSQ